MSCIENKMEGKQEKKLHIYHRVQPHQGILKYKLNNKSSLSIINKQRPPILQVKFKVLPSSILGCGKLLKSCLVLLSIDRSTQELWKVHQILGPSSESSLCVKWDGQHRRGEHPGSHRQELRSPFWPGGRKQCLHKKGTRASNSS